MKALGYILFLIASLAGSGCDARMRAALGNIEARFLFNAIKSFAIVTDDSTRFGDTAIVCATGTAHRHSKQGYDQAARLDPGGQSYDFTITEFYIGANDDLWTASPASLLCRICKKAFVVVPD